MSISRRDEIRERMAETWPNPARCSAAAKELDYRLKRTGCSLPPRTRSRADKWPRGRADSVLKRETNRTEILIVRALARTSSAAQFLCTPRGDVYTADTDGWALPTGRRDNLTGLSALLDEVARVFNHQQRDGYGGRFYERDGCFFDADDGSIFFEIGITQHNGDYPDWDSYAGWPDAREDWADSDEDWDTDDDWAESDEDSADAREDAAGDRPESPERNMLQKVFDWLWN